jgi:hypothetical protein
MYYVNDASLLREVKKVAGGRKSKIPTTVLMQFVLNYCENHTERPEPLENDEVRWCERLYKLEDPRGNECPPKAHTGEL